MTSQGWDGPTSLCLMRDLMVRTGSLVDNQAGINNYSDYILNQPEKLTNHSSEWESGLSLTDPEIQAMIDKHPTRAPPQPDRDWDRCMNLDLSRKENDPKSRVTDFNIRENDISSVTSGDQGPPPKKFHFKSVNNSESSFLNLKPVTSINQETPEIVNRNLPLQQSNSIPPRSVQIDLAAYIVLFYFNIYSDKPLPRRCLAAGAPSRLELLEVVGLSIRRPGLACRRELSQLTDSCLASGPPVTSSGRSREGGRRR